MAYIVTRTVLVALAWGATCWLIATFLPETSLAVFCFVGLSWALAGIVCFGYIRNGVVSST